MAMEAQGLRIRRASTVTVNSSAATAMDIQTTVIDCPGTIDFAALGFTTNHCIRFSSVDTGFYPIKSVVTTAINVYGPILTTNATADIVITGHLMEEIGEVNDFSGPGGGAAVIDITHLQSTAKQKLIGLRDEGQLTMSVNYNATDAGQVGLKNDRAARRKGLFDILFTDALITSTSYPSRSWFEAYCLLHQITGAVDDKISASLTLEITGPVVDSTRINE